MSERKRYTAANSFKSEEIEVFVQFMRAVRQGRDTRMFLRNPNLANVETKFSKMQQGIANKRRADILGGDAEEE